MEDESVVLSLIQIGLLAFKTVQQSGILDDKSAEELAVIISKIEAVNKKQQARVKDRAQRIIDAHKNK
jgi:hypothetical protein